ncbi:MAG: hypothetical protein RIT28_2492, partial [Pseudomonadota bacterium]
MSVSERPTDAVSESTYEALSRLLDGDLPPDEAEALRARVHAEPALAEALGRLRALGEAVAALPEVSPPPALNTAVLRRVRDEARAPANAPLAW